MATIPASSNWIEIDSAFGGFAIYRRNWFDLVGYVGVADDGEEVCEHVSFNTALRRNGAKLYINPQQNNAELTLDTQHLRFSRTLMRGFRSILDDSLEAALGPSRAAELKRKIKGITHLTSRTKIEAAIIGGIAIGLLVSILFSAGLRDGVLIAWAAGQILMSGRAVG